MIQKIYLDMDGVIADFDRGYNSIFGLNCRDDPNKNNWEVFILEHEGFLNLHIMKDASKLINHVLNIGVPVEILSCAGRASTFTKVVEQKTEWLKLNGLRDLRANFTTTKLEKSKYATKTSLLIDDSIQCIEPFIKAGGHGILHQNADDTIQKLAWANLECVLL